MLSKYGGEVEWAGKVFSSPMIRFYSLNEPVPVGSELSVSLIPSPTWYRTARGG